ncbi:hypothetical protein EBR96_01440 [bacterium]|nr:hypothetical protein [bacterium]
MYRKYLKKIVAKPGVHSFSSSSFRPILLEVFQNIPCEYESALPRNAGFVVQELSRSFFKNILESSSVDPIRNLLRQTAKVKDVDCQRAVIEALLALSSCEENIIALGPGIFFDCLIDVGIMTRVPDQRNEAYIYGHLLEKVSEPEAFDTPANRDLLIALCKSKDTVTAALAGAAICSVVYRISVDPCYDGRANAKKPFETDDVRDSLIAMGYWDHLDARYVSKAIAQMAFRNKVGFGTDAMRDMLIRMAGSSYPDVQDNVLLAISHFSEPPEGQVTFGTIAVRDMLIRLWEGDQSPKRAIPIAKVLCNLSAREENMYFLANQDVRDLVVGIGRTEDISSQLGDILTNFSRRPEHQVIFDTDAVRAVSCPRRD